MGKLRETVEAYAAGKLSREEMIQFIVDFKFAPMKPPGMNVLEAERTAEERYAGDMPDTFMELSILQERGLIEHEVIMEALRLNDEKVAARIREKRLRSSEHQ